MAGLTDQEEYELLSLEKEHAMSSARPDRSVPTDSPKQPKGMMSKLYDDTLGSVLGVADMVGSLPGLVGAGTAALVHGATGGKTGRDFPETLDEIMGSSSKGNVVDHLAPEKALEATRGTAGYQATQEALMSPFQGFGNIAAAGADALGADPETAYQAGRYGSAVPLAGAMIGGLRGKAGPKAGTAEFYRNLHEDVITGKKDNPAVTAQARAQDELELKKLEEEKIKADETAFNNKDAQRTDTGNLPDENIRTPYNLDPAEKARLEAELNPPVEDRPGNQGELFTEERAYTPDELSAKRFVTDESGVGARDKTMPVERELGATVHTADVIDGAAQAQGEFKYQDAIPYKEHIPASEVARRIKLGRGQGGVISPDLLTFGTARIWEAAQKRFPDVKEAFTSFMKRWEGTYDPETLGHAIRNSLDPKSKSTIVLMSPDEFHRLAEKRDFSVDDRKGPQNYFEAKRNNVREALKTKRGLFDIPELTIRNGEVVAHEGRHRMDVFKEQGMDKVPVILKDDFRRWGEKEAPASLVGQNGDVIKTPKSLTFPNGPTQTRPQVPLSQRGAIGDWSKRVDKAVQGKGLAALAIEARQQFQSLYGKSLKDVFKDQPLDPKTIQDFGSESEGLLGRMANVKDAVLTHTMIDKSLSILAQNKTGLGRIVKFSVDNRKGIELAKDVAIRDGVKEAISHWKEVPHADLRSMMDVWTQNVGKGELVRESFKNDVQYETFKKTRDYLNKFLDKINEKRDKFGLATIAHIENYLPAIWEGDYRIWIKDQTGTNKGVFGFKSVYQADRAYKMLKAEHPDLIVEDPIHRRTDAGDLDARVLKDAGRQRNINYALSHDLSGFEEALSVMSKDDPVTKAVQATYAKLLTTKGFNKSLLERKNLFGYLGFEKGDLGPKNMERALEMYIKRGENHMANLDKAHIMQQLVELPLEIREKIPKGLAYLEDYLMIARGADLGKGGIITPIAQAISRAVGFGESGIERGIRGMSSAVSMALLMRPGFFLGNLTQHMNVLPKLVDLGQLDKSIRNPISSYFMGMAHAYSHKGIREKVAQEWVDWAGKNGYLESSIVSMLNMRFSDLGYERGAVVMDSSRWVLGKVERDTVRMQAGMIMEYALRDSVPDKVARFKEAAELMDHYMVAYDTAAQPLMYNKMGQVAGGIARPLKQYSHNAFGQFFEYAQTAKDQHRLAPMATYLGVQMSIGGLKGTILVAEATAAVLLLNTWFNLDIPTPEQLLRKGAVKIRNKFGEMSGNIADAMVIGGYSTILGADISSSVNAPNLPQMFQLAPLQFSANAVKEVGTYFAKKLKGTATEADTMSAVLAVSPLGMKGWVEEYFRKPNGIVPNPNRRMQGDYRRDEKYFDGFGLGEKGKAMLSLKSLKESDANAMGRLLRQEFAREAQMKLEAIDAIADRVIEGKSLDGDLMNRYIKEGGDPKNLIQNIRNRIKQRAMTFEEQQQSGNMTMQKADHLKRMTDYLNQSKSGGGGGQGEIDPMSQDRVDLLNKSVDTKTAAKIRAHEAGNDSEKIQDRIDGLQKRLDVRGKGALEGSSRSIIRRELKDWENAKQYVKPIGDLPEMSEKEQKWREYREALLNKTPRGNDTDGHNAFATYTSRQIQGYPDWYRSPTTKGSNIGDLDGAGVPVPNAQDHRRKTRGTM